MTRVLKLAALLFACLLGCATAASAQRGPGGPPGGGGPGRGPGMGPPPSSAGPSGAPDNPGRTGPGSTGGSSTGSLSPGMTFGPPGRWWDERRSAAALGIGTDQQHRLDQVFNTNRDALFARYTDLKREEAQLARLTQSSSPNEKQVDAQIERVSQARAELAKANAHMVLALRKELTPEQAARLDSR